MTGKKADRIVVAAIVIWAVGLLGLRLISFLIHRLAAFFQFLRGVLALP